MTRFGALLALLSSLPTPAHAETTFAEPPPGGTPFVADESEPVVPGESVVVSETFQGSSVRVSVGPALRIGSRAAAGGLSGALDVGDGAVGGRISGAWVRVGSAGGLSQYGAELWVDFGEARRLRPIVGAGAGLARVEAEGADGSLRTASLGVGTLRGSLEYRLPVERADARAAIDVLGAIPAAKPRSVEEHGAWLLCTARVGIGF